jgi:hypothetical protein
MCSKTTLGVHAMVAVFAVWLLTETSGSAQQPAGAPRIQGDVDCAVTSPNGIERARRMRPAATAMRRCLSGHLGCGRTERSSSNQAAQVLSKRMGRSG